MNLKLPTLIISSQEKREILIDYKGVECILVVNVLGEEVNFRVAALLKEHCAKNLVEELCWEVGFASDIQSPKDLQADAEILGPFNSTRRVVNEELLAESWTSGDELQILITKKTPKYLNIDPSFHLELGFLKAMMGTAGERKIDNIVLCKMPTKIVGGQVLSMANVVCNLKAIREEAFFKFVASTAQTKLNVVIGMIASMDLGRAPDLAALPDTRFYRQFRLHLGYFCIAP